MNRGLIVVGVALTAFAVFADQERTQEGEDDGLDEHSEMSLEGASNASTINPTPAVASKNSMRQGRSKGILFVPSKEMRTLPKVFLTAGVATQTKLKGGGGGWGQGGGGGGGWGGGGNGGGGGGGGWGGGGGGGWGWGPPPGWGWGSGGGGGWCKPMGKSPSPKRAMKAAMKAQQALMKAQRQAAKAQRQAAKAAAKAGMGGGWGGGGSHADMGGDWVQNNGGGWGGNGGNNGGWNGGGKGGGGGGWRNSARPYKNDHRWQAELDNEILLGPTQQLHTPIVTEDFSTESDIEDDEWLNSLRGSRLIVGGSEPRTFDMLENPLPILFGGDLQGARSFYGRSGFPEGEDTKTETHKASVPPKTYQIRSRGRLTNPSGLSENKFKKFNATTRN